MPRIITKETLVRSLVMDSLQKAVDDFESDLPFGDEVRLVIKTKDDMFQIVRHSGTFGGYSTLCKNFNIWSANISIECSECTGLVKFDILPDDQADIRVWMKIHWCEIRKIVIDRKRKESKMKEECTTFWEESK